MVSLHSRLVLMMKMARHGYFAFALCALFSCSRFVACQEVITLNFGALRQDPPSSPPQPTPTPRRWSPEKCDQPCVHCWGTESPPNDIACDISQLLNDNERKDETSVQRLTLSYLHPSNPSTTCVVEMYQAWSNPLQYDYRGGYCDEDENDEVQPAFQVKDLEDLAAATETSSGERELCDYKLKYASGRELNDVCEVKFLVSTFNCVKPDPNAGGYLVTGRKPESFSWDGKRYRPS